MQFVGEVCGLRNTVTALLALREPKGSIEEVAEREERADSCFMFNTYRAKEGENVVPAPRRSLGKALGVTCKGMAHKRVVCCVGLR
jgi:hypothetical protein